MFDPSDTVSLPPAAHSTQKTDEIAQWIAAGERATAAAHAFLRAHGASIIYGRGDVVCEELPDGTVLTHLPKEIPPILPANSKPEETASLVLHDRLLLTDDVQQGSLVRITYTDGVGHVNTDTDGVGHVNTD